MLEIYSNPSWIKKYQSSSASISQSSGSMVSVSPDLTLFVSVFNRMDHFQLVFASIEAQTHANFEVLICDDGSKAEFVTALRLLLDQSQIPCRHLWHPDVGVRKVEILNWGVIHSRAEYLVMIDGDCVLHPQFLADHWRHRQTQAVLAGRRMDLTSFVTNRLTMKNVRAGFLQTNFFWIFFSGLLMKDNNAIKALRIKNNFLRALFNRKPREIVGCNFSLYRSDLLAINGYDNRYNQGLGTAEDSDIDFRLRLNGVQVIPFCHLGIQYHCYHKTRPKGPENEQLFAEVRAEGKARTGHGIDQMVQS